MLLSRNRCGVESNPVPLGRGRGGFGAAGGLGNIWGCLGGSGGGREEEVTLMGSGGGWW